ncbi:MAG: Gfo/Idh/MocA family oxidoreductase, partial [Acidobacteria bacterium]|nr:Gfo/Idh/MocA family oxidoreductase [Acidobacteriota bacterium]
RSAAGVAGFGLLLNGEPVPLEASPVLPRPASPSDRVGVGFIGAGIRGHILMDAAKQTGQADLIVVSDCYQGHLDRAKERTDGKIETNFAQFRKILERKDVDAVVIATPDHWHLPMVLDALSAGKDVYIEKPMTKNVQDGPKMIAAAQRYNRIVQAGSQWISMEQHKKAKELVASGRLGKVTKITAAYNRNSSSGAWNYPIPPDLENGVNFNWEEWLGPARKRPYNPEYVFRYRKYWDFSGGISTDLFVHLINSIHFIMGSKMPKSVVATGGILFRHDGREVPDTLDALFEYPEGFNVNMASTFNSASTAGQGIQLLGTDASLTLLLGQGDMILAGESHREGYGYSIDSWPKALQEKWLDVDNRREEAKRTAPEPETLKTSDPMDATGLHMLEFFECVRSRKPCAEHAEIGHQAAAAGHMVNISYRSGKKVKWDAKSGTVKA